MLCARIDSRITLHFRGDCPTIAGPKKLCHAFCITTRPPRGRRSNETYLVANVRSTWQRYWPSAFIDRGPPGQESIRWHYRHDPIYSREIIDDYGMEKKERKIEWAITISLSTTVSPISSTDRRLLRARYETIIPFSFRPIRLSETPRGIKVDVHHVFDVNLRFQLGVENDQRILFF